MILNGLMLTTVEKPCSSNLSLVLKGMQFKKLIMRGISSALEAEKLTLAMIRNIAHTMNLYFVRFLSCLSEFCLPVKSAVRR